MNDEIIEAFVSSGTIPPNAEIIDDPGLPLQLTPEQQHAIDHGYFMSQQRRDMAERELLALTKGMPEWKPKSPLRRAFYALGAPQRMLRRGLIRLLGGTS